MITKKNLIYLSQYLKGFADAKENETVYKAHQAIEYLILNVCGQGFICTGGDECKSDHK